MRILVTGGRGMLGSDICAVFARRGHDVRAAGSADFDIGDPAATLHAIRDAAPQAIVHCAAYTDVDGCERDPDRAYRINSLGAGHVAYAANAVGAGIIAVSTDFVFDGRNGAPYSEFDPTAPLGAYGRSKLAGEALVKSSCPHHKIVRTSWLYGARGKCFPKSMIYAARAGRDLRVVADQTGSPTYTRDLAEAIADLADTPSPGTFHLSNSGQCTWHEFAVAVIHGAGMPDLAARIAPIRSDEWPTPTERPKFSVLHNYAWELLGKPPLRTWRDALGDFLAELSADDA